MSGLTTTPEMRIDLHVLRNRPVVSLPEERVRSRDSKHPGNASINQRQTWELPLFTIEEYCMTLIFSGPCLLAGDVITQESCKACARLNLQVRRLSDLN